MYLICFSLWQSCPQFCISSLSLLIAIERFWLYPRIWGRLICCHLLTSHFVIYSAETLAGFSNKESVQKEVKATLSQKATLSCEVSDSKTEVKWYKDGKLLTSSKAVHMESKGKSRELVIEKMEKKDAGEYTCEAGTEKLVFKLQMTGTNIF
uniref:Ig-like domain-containing protein n=1 Tax=Seriola dumerili TaxID=41447 RepID=A0A3B4V073_SERDU